MDCCRALRKIREITMAFSSQLEALRNSILNHLLLITFQIVFCQALRKIRKFTMTFSSQIIALR